MLPIRLEIRNFLPFRSPDPILFEGIHLACLTGPNGAGKSSLLDAITWALWGKARAKRDEELIHLGQQDMYVQMDFEQGGQLYRVVRKRNRKQRTGTLDLLIQDEDEQFNLISEPSMRATQERINQLLRLDYETFVNSAFLQQGKADAFTTRTPKERKQILADILGLDQWERYEEAVKEQEKALSAELSVIALRLDEITQELANEPALQAEHESAQTAQANAKATLEDAEARLEKLADAPVRMNNAQQNLHNAERYIRQYEDDLQSVALDISRTQERIDTYNAVLAQQAEIEQGYASLQAAREADDSLGYKLRQIRDADALQHQLEAELQQAINQIENEASGYEAQIKELTLQEDTSAISEALEDVQAEIAMLRQLEQERDTLREQSSALGEERGEKKAANDALRTEMFDIRARLDQLAQNDTAECPLCGQALSEAHRQSVTAELEASGKQRGDTYRNNESRGKEIDEIITNNTARIKQIDQQLKPMPQLLERAGTLQAQIDAAAKAATRAEKARKKLAQVQAQLTESKFIRKVRKQLAELEEERQKIGYSAESHDAARAQLDQFRDYESQQVRLENARLELPNVQESLLAAQKRQERTHAAIAEEQAKATAIQQEITTLEVLMAQFNAIQQEVSSLRTAERVAYQRLVNAKQSLDALEHQRARHAELQARAKEKRQTESLYKELRVAFGKNGIPAMIIEAAIPELESAANQLLSRMTQGRMHLSLNTQREKVTGGVAETLDIQIADELGTRSYELYSGGESFRINFAIRVALSQMLARRAGAQLQTLFIDEGFGTQDDEGRDRLVEAITAIQDSFELILIITHIEELRDSFPVHVVIDKTPQGSRVAIR
jgi:exonuclease SbcC